MFDKNGSASAASVNFKSLEFFTIQLSPLPDGNVYVAMTATTIDETEPQLLDQEIARDSVATMDEVLALIRSHVSIAPRHFPTP